MKKKRIKDLWQKESVVSIIKIIAATCEYNIQLNAIKEFSGYVFESTEAHCRLNLITFDDIERWHCINTDESEVISEQKHFFFVFEKETMCLQININPNDVEIILEYSNGKWTQKDK